jgi:hypothetical protein
MKRKELIYNKFECGTKYSKSDSKTDSKSSKSYTSTIKFEQRTQPYYSANLCTTKPSSGIASL